MFLMGAIYSDLFDPPTKGDLFIIRHGITLYSPLVVNIEPGEDPWFSQAERRSFLSDLLRDEPGEVSVTASPYEAAHQGDELVLYGVRDNRIVRPRVNGSSASVSVEPPYRLWMLSSEMIRHMVDQEWPQWEDNIKPFIPDNIYHQIVDIMKRKLKERRQIPLERRYSIESRP
jgi:phosphopantetheine adenylyltransferase